MSVQLRSKLLLKNSYSGEISSLKFKLHDDVGNALAIYKDIYHRLPNEFKQFLSSNAPIQEKIAKLRENNINLVTYFNNKNLQNYLVRNIESIDQIPGIVHDGSQNCVIVRKEKVYVHPKIRSNPFVVGVNHSSLSNGRAVDFAGSLVKKDDRWLLNNTTGHYGTRASKLSACLKAFVENNISIEHLDVEHWILIDSSKPDDDASYLIKTIPAIILLHQMSCLHGPSSLDKMVVNKK